MTRNLSLSNAHQAVEPIIFIVDESKVVCEVLTAALEEEGDYRVYSFIHVVDTLSSISRIVPDLFIIDYQLSQMTGLELYSQLQAKSTRLRIPCILLNAPSSVVQKNYLWQLNKPFGLDDLLEKVKEALLFPSV